MHKPILVALFAALSVTQAYAACENLSCDPCPLYRAPNGTTASQAPTSECIKEYGQDLLNCYCDPPAQDWVPAGRESVSPSPLPGNTEGPATPAPVATPSPNPSPQLSGDNGEGDDLDILPPDGGTGAVIPTQSFGTPAASAATLLSHLVSLQFYRDYEVTFLPITFCKQFCIKC